jgi:hypothetical protein
VADLVLIMEEMADKIRATLSTVDFPVQVEPRMIFNPTCPSVDIYPANPSREQESAGMGDLAGAYLFTVRARFLMDDTDSGQELALAMMNDNDDLCLGWALFDDQTLNGYASSVFVDDPSGFLAFDPHMGVTWRVTVYAVDS